MINRKIMRTIFIFILAYMPIIGYAQVDVEFSFDKERKEATLILINRGDDTFKLSPKIVTESIPGIGSFYTFLYRDKNSKIVYKRNRFIYDDLPSTEYRSGQYLFPHGSNKYQYDFDKWYTERIQSIEVYIQVEAINLRTKKSYKKEIKQILSYE